ncbi:MAG: hypothetical protein IPF93_22125 [Saprospiraceae bacterium]|nr:hypothetical protein [Saprospiraceae bacterium]
MDLWRSFSLGNMVWADRNNDGLYDLSREQVISGVVMELHKVIDTVDEEDTSQLRYAG